MLSAGTIALQVDLDASTWFSRVWNKTGFFAGAPIVADRAVWTVDIDGFGQSGILYALSPASGAVLFSASIGSVGQFVTPSADHDLIFVGGNQSIEAFQSVK